METYVIHRDWTTHPPHAMVTDNTNVTNTSLSTRTQVPEPPLYILAATTTMYVLLFLSGVLGNSLVIFVVCRNKDMRSSTNFFLVNLSVADLLVILICMPTALVDIYAKEVWYLGRFMCELVPFLENLVADASVLTILAISFERYYAICRPLQAQYMCTFRRMVKIVALIYLIAALECLPFYWITRYKGSYLLDGTPIKVCRSYINTSWKVYFILTRFFALFICPFVLLSIIYAVISRKLVNESYAIRSVGKRSRSNMRTRRQVVLMLLAVVVVFFLCHLPLRTIQVWMILTEGALTRLGLEGYLNVVYFSRCMFYLNSAVNPIVYNMFSSKWRSAFKRIFGILKPTKRSDTTMMTLSLYNTNTIRHSENSEKSSSNFSRRTS